MEEYESYETTTTLELSPEPRMKAMMDFTDAFSALLQSGIRILFIGENLEENELYFVCADPELTFNEDFDSIYGLMAPVVIEDCKNFEDFLAKSGISVVPEEE